MVWLDYFQAFVTWSGSQDIVKIKMTIVISLTTLFLLAIASELTRPIGLWNFVKIELHEMHLDLMEHLLIYDWIFKDKREANQPA